MRIETKHTIPLLRAVESGQIKGYVSISEHNWSLSISAKKGIQYNYFCCDDVDCGNDEFYEYKSVNDFAEDNLDLGHIGSWWLDTTITDNPDQVKAFIDRMEVVE